MGFYYFGYFQPVPAITDEEKLQRMAINVEYVILVGCLHSQIV